MLFHRIEHQNEIDTAFHNRGYEAAIPTSISQPLEMSGQFTPNGSYARVSHVPTSHNGVDNSYADPYEMRGDADSNNSDMLANPLYEVIDESGETTRSISCSEHGYSVLDKERHVSKDPVESRPRKNITSTTNDEYSKLER